MGENKEWTCELLFQTLDSTRRYHNTLAELNYEKDGEDEFVEIVFDAAPAKKVDVTADSCFAMIKDILKALR